MGSCFPSFRKLYLVQGKNHPSSEAAYGVGGRCWDAPTRETGSAVAVGAWRLRGGVWDALMQEMGSAVVVGVWGDGVSKGCPLSQQGWILNEDAAATRAAAQDCGEAHYGQLWGSLQQSTAWHLCSAALWLLISPKPFNPPLPLNSTREYRCSSIAAGLCFPPQARPFLAQPVVLLQLSRAGSAVGICFPPENA